MFLKNDYARPLFDFEKGGEARAYECLLSKNDVGLNLEKRNSDISQPKGVSYPCGKITKTESGMRAHLKSVHQWKEQTCLYSTDSPSGQGEPRQLRAGPPQLKSSEQPSLMETIPVIQESQEMNVNELLKPTKEEN